MDTKRNSFKEFLNGLTKSQTFGSSYKIIKDKFKTNVLNSKLSNDYGEYTENSVEARNLTITKKIYNASIVEEDLEISSDYNDIYDQDLKPIEIHADVTMALLLILLYIFIIYTLILFTDYIILLGAMDLSLIIGKFLGSD